MGYDIARILSLWTVFDVEDCKFVFCIRKAVGSEISVTKMNSMQCRYGSERRCINEVACVNTIAASGNVNFNDSGDLQETQMTRTKMIAQERQQ